MAVPPECQQAGAVKRTLAGRLVYHSPWMQVREDDIVEADGSRSTFAVVVRPSFVVVVCLLDDDALLLVRQFRYATRSCHWELPQGAVEPGEDVERAALRELEEEAGWEAEEASVLARGLYEAGDWATQTFSVVAVRATGRRAWAPQRSEATLTSRVATIQELRAMIASGQIVDPPTICALYLLELWRAGRPRLGGAAAPVLADGR